MKRIFISLALVLSTYALAAQVGINTNTPNASAALDVSSTITGFLPPRMDSSQRNLISSPAIGLVIYNTTTKGLECWNGTKWNSTLSTVHFIGENYGGGIVFYVYDNGQHGLIAATADQGTGIQWYNGTNKYTGTTGDGVGAGVMNTTLIVASQLSDNPIGSFSAKVCADYSIAVGGVNYGDWYLPSKFELNLLFIQRTIVGGFALTGYWSSSEVDNISAWEQNFISGGQFSPSKNNVNNVRAVRAF